jgi:glycosyltransferase involved in cell wall biosynthesis
MCKAGDKPDLVVSYNVWGPVAAACRHASDAHGVPWIPFLLDHDRPTENWANVKSGIRGASGVAFVSQWAFERAPVARKLHLDAGVVSVPDVPPTRSRSRILLYTGALHQWGGIETLLDSLPLLATPGVTLVVVGRGGSKHLHHRLATTPGVEYHGGVDEPTLQRLTQQAEVLANPRPHGVQGNEMNFPSKLLHYLTSLKPVATTLTPGVAPSYRDVVIAADDDSPAAFAAAVDRSFALDDAEWKALVGRIRSFLSEGKLWSHQAQRFITWADEMLVDQRAGAIATTSRP